VRQITHDYDGLGRRVATGTASGNRITVFGQDQEVLSESALTTGSTPPSGYYDYVWFAGRPIAQVDATGTHWTFGDHLGTPNLQTDINGNVSWRAEYEPFGKVWALRAGDVHQPLRFPGQTAEQFDTGANGATERSYNNARWYRAGWGRYTQADPIGLRGSPYNFYGYGGNNPLGATDPLGLAYLGFHTISLGPIDLGGEGHRFIYIPAENGQAATTLSGEPSGSFPNFKNLISQPGADLGFVKGGCSLIHIAPPKGKSDTQFDAILKTEFQYYQQNSSASYSYQPFGYNSNSLAAGGIEAAGTSLPDYSHIFSGVSFPGSQIPIPASAFGVK